MKNITKQLPYENIVADYAVNYRLENNYKLDIMEHQLISSGQVNNPLHVEYIKDSDPPRYLVLQGNRRYRAVGNILENVAYSEDVKKPFRKLNCIIHEGLTPEERADLIADHGSAEPLCREETVAAIWRHMLLGKTEEQIGMQFYSQLANYTGEQKRLNQLPPIGSPDRRKKIKEWFAGTLRGQIMNAFRMGEFVQKQFLLTRRSEDGRLDPEKDKIEMKCGTARIQALSKARSDDEKAGQWNYDTGGPTFNALIEKYKSEDLTGNKDDGPKRTKEIVIETWRDAYKSTPIRTAMQAVLGDEKAKLELQKVNNTWLAVNERLEELRKIFPRIKDDSMREFVRELLSDGPLGGFTTALEPFLASYNVVAPLTEPAPIVHETVDSVGPESQPTENTPTDGGETVQAVEPTAVDPTAVEPAAVEPAAVEPAAVEQEVIAEVTPELESAIEEEVEQPHHKSKPRAHAHSGRRGKGKGK